jgi:putative ABC transport system permease protein
VNDIRFAFRQLGKAPGFTLVALLTLTIGIGACTAIFSVVNRVLLQPLDYPHSEQLIYIGGSHPPDMPRFSVSVGDFFDWRKRSTSFAGLAALNYGSFNLTGSGDPVRIGGARVTVNYLSMLGVHPAMGRDFTPGEDAAGRDDVAIIGDGFWSRQFGGRADVVGQVIHIDGSPVTIIGVMPRDFHGQDIMFPAAFSPDDMNNHGSHYLVVIARLKPGVTLSQAEGDLKAVAAGLAKQYPNSNKGWTVIMRPLLEQMVGRVRPQLLALLAAVGFLLFIGCANVANLLLVRASARSREIAVRAALGASHGRIVRQLLVEHLVLALLGGLGGILAAYWGVHLLLTLAPNSVPRSGEITVDLWALAFSVALALLTGVGFGLVPALHAARVDINSVLKEAGRGSGEGHSRHRLRNSLVIAELTIAVVLLTGAGLLMRSFARLESIDPGFRAESAVVANVSLPDKKYNADAKQAAFARQACEKLAAMPGVAYAAVSQSLPFGGDYVLTFAIDGKTVSAGDLPVANYYSVTPSYFKAMGIPLLRGRLFTEGDAAGGHLVTIVSKTMATRFFPGQDPIGKRINIQNDTGVWSEIVGVVGDVKQYGLEPDAPPATYEPFAQHPFGFQTLILRMSGPTGGISGGIQSAIRSIDPEQPVGNIRPLADLVKGSISSQRFAMNLFMVFSAAALLLATIGIYGVMAYSVTQRTAEIGVRMALGAQHGDILRMIAGQGARLIAIGIACGLAGSLVLTRFIASMLYGVGAADPATMAGACLVLGLAALSACLLSARRATRIEPITALRVS